MILGIVGHAADKFTPLTEYYAKKAIRHYLIEHNPSRVNSGGCHLGGVDKWAIKIVKMLGILTVEYLPKNLNWSTGYKPRNLLIANNSDKVLVVVVKEYPPNYDGMVFDGCYHCGDRNPSHVKSGGCWTAWKCKDREWIFI